ncbi:hypothetical protein LOK49_LG15G00594 [Camellia lanceoleosa]|uniref:Uncharacterized protein n=1 Tax=Camellia lanceoleosa TaxID=1840588 RepID=A0ACC0F0B3_9ERIC|nr:hypothetical protein LOK49_LG15G00594 [Camellia lanceoleosa]
MKASLRSFLVSELEFSITASSNFKSQLVSSSIRMRLTFVLKKLGGARGFAAVNAQGHKIKGVEDIIAVASGKGGVGKSTTAGNASLSFSVSVFTHLFIEISWVHDMIWILLCLVANGLRLILWVLESFAVVSSV